METQCALLGDVIVNKINTVFFHFHEVSKIVKFIEKRTVDTRGWGEERRLVI